MESDSNSDASMEESPAYHGNSTNGLLNPPRRERQASRTKKEKTAAQPSHGPTHIGLGSISKANQKEQKAKRMTKKEQAE